MSKLPYFQRQAYGMVAEKVFLEVLPLGSAIKYGWDGAGLSMAHMDPFLRHTPDFYCNTGTLVEVQGCGKDLLMKVKLAKLDELLKWNKTQDTKFFFWNSSLNQWVLTSVEAVAALSKQYDTKVFHDGPEYKAIPWEDLLDIATETGYYRIQEAEELPTNIL